MERFRFDVIVIGCGPAGATAAVTLARSGLSVLVLEAGHYPGAENWSGCVYFGENLAQADAFGEDALPSSPFERPVVRRGAFLHNGLDLVGLSYQQPDTFKHCYTVLRPVFDPYWAALARSHGAMVISGTTATALLRKGKRVIGVETTYGPAYANSVFIAEGDASHLIRREQLEKVSKPHFLQGVKTVLNLPSSVIEERFDLFPGDGCAYEYVIRNGLVGGQTVHLNIGAFLYTNKNSLSVGYVVPLDNLAQHYRGEHAQVLEWIRSLPHFKSLLRDARLAGYGTKLIRMGGRKEQPILVEDGLAVGGAPTGLGIDLPYPNFTGPASASGLYFARALRDLLKDGKPPSAENLKGAYLEPLTRSVYGANADFLAGWPDYMGKTPYLFGKSVDLVCGSAHFLTEPRSALWLTGRFVRNFIGLKTLRSLSADLLDFLKASGMGKSLLSALSPGLILRWFSNLVYLEPKTDLGLTISILIDDRRAIGNRRFSRPFESLIRRLTPGISQAMKIVYTNDDTPLEEKFTRAFRSILKRVKITDFITLPITILILVSLGVLSGIWDLIRYKILRRPLHEIFSGPVHEYMESQKDARNINGPKPKDTLDAKLALNSYRLTQNSHIRILWPAELTRQSDLNQSALWSVCPAKVYQYEAPLFGRGRTGINFENCIKCESCWHSEEDQVLWGRHTNHSLIYRSDSDSIDKLLVQKPAERAPNPPETLSPPPLPEFKTPEQRQAFGKTGASVLNALGAFETAVASLPSSADTTRVNWVKKVGETVLGRLDNLEKNYPKEDISGNGSSGFRELRDDFKAHLEKQHFFYSLGAIQKIRDELAFYLTDGKKPGLISTPAPAGERHGSTAAPAPFDYAWFQEHVPERTVKEWEDTGIPPDWREKLLNFLKQEKQDGDPEFSTQGLIHGLSYIDPALGLLGAHHCFSQLNLKDPPPGTRGIDFCAVEASGLSFTDIGDAFSVKGTLEFVPLALARNIFLVKGTEGWPLSLNEENIEAVPDPGIGLRTAAFHRLIFKDVRIQKNGTPLAHTGNGIPTGLDFGAIAMGAADYLIRRGREHALNRVQFSNQMLDTQGRDGIAKLGAVKKLLARSEAWHILLDALMAEGLRAEEREKPPWFNPLLGITSGLAFNPNIGSLGYDIGQIFGGMAYSEDDRISRAYRDSSIFRFLSRRPGDPDQLCQHIGPMLKSGQTPFWGPGAPPDFDGPFSDLFGRWEDLVKNWIEASENTSPADSCESLALLTGSYFLILNAHRRFERGLPTETHTGACFLLLDLTEERISDLLLWNNRPADLPIAYFPEKPTGDPVELPMSYEELSSTGLAGKTPPYRSGDFLREVFNSSPRFVPEIQLHDSDLRARFDQSSAWFKKRFQDKSFEGLPLERYVEKIHGIPEGILPDFKKEGYFSTVIPSKYDGGDWWKAEYYILTTAAGHFGDAGLLLVIMASTSIGTTPVLLGIEKELPLAKQEIEDLANDPAILGGIGKKLDNLVASLEHPDPRRVKKDFTDLMEQVDHRIRKTRVTKYLAANFLKTFYSAGVAGQRRDLNGFSNGLREAQALFASLGKTIQNAATEIPRRTKAHGFFLKQLGHGGISAFALTEPTAGSDSGGVKTTARLKVRPLEALEDGRYRFSLREEPGDSEEDFRYLVDADRIRFTPGDSGLGMAFSPPDSGPNEPGLKIHFDDYNYQNDEGLRYFILDGKNYPFHDIAQVRNQNGVPVYEYYELNGAKMWITNGRVATQFCLYAQSPEGVTGFMVDRHAEGLKIGADERKMGQRGSPTNEIAIDQVRVPRECIIGYEGHGQVNALETLNVGRCGLAVASVFIMRKLIMAAETQAPASDQREAYLSEASAILFGSESATFHLIGLFDHHLTESVRMESAIAKYVTSEDLHEVFALVENALGPSAMTERFGIEKLRRDSRILNIYEGTNEVQRFLVLKDLVSGFTPLKQNRDENPSPEVSPLREFKEKLHGHLEEAIARLGDSIWMDAVLQPTFFPLAEMAGELFRLDCIIYRTRWLEENRLRLGENYLEPLIRLSERAVARCINRLERSDRAYTRNATQWKKNLYHTETTVADSALETPVHPTPMSGVMNREAKGPIRILCILRRVPDPGPEPRLRDDKNAELSLKLNQTDEAALSQLLNFKKTAPRPVELDAVVTGPEAVIPLFQSELGADIDHVFRLEGNNKRVETALVQAINQLEEKAPYHWILAGGESEDGSDPLAPYLAGSLKRRPVCASSLSVQGERVVFVSEEKDRFEQSIGDAEGTGLVVSWEGNPEPLSLSLNRMVKRSASEIPSLSGDGDSREAAMVPEIKFHRPKTPEKTEGPITDIPGVVHYIRNYILRNRSGHDFHYEGLISKGVLPAQPAQWAIIDSGDSRDASAVFGGTSILQQSLNQESFGLILSPEKEWSGLAGIARARGIQHVFLLDTPEGRLRPEGQKDVLRKLVDQANPLGLTAGSRWADSMSWIAGLYPDREILRFTQLSEINRREGIWLHKAAFGGKLRRSLNLNTTRFNVLCISVAGSAEFPKVDPYQKFSATRIKPSGFPFTEKTFQDKPPDTTDNLETAETILDIGYGIRDQEGLKLVEKLKARLEELGLNIVLGATRKVTQDLKLLPVKHQIGQTGVRVKPKLILAFGISGAPQHMDYIDEQAVIFSFNKDPEAPLMTYNQHRPSPLVHPVSGDLFSNLTRLIREL